MTNTIFENKFCKVEKITTTSAYVLTSKRGDMYPPQTCLTLEEVSKKTMIPLSELEAGEAPEPISFTRINNDTNGNPRYVCHWVNFFEGYTPENMRTYEWAVHFSHALGGRKYHTKKYGGGIVFQSYNIRELEKDIIALRKKISHGYRPDR